MSKKHKKKKKKLKTKDIIGLVISALTAIMTLIALIREFLK